MSIHGLLAAELALGWKKPPYPAWNAVLPTLDDIEASVPFMWPSQLQRLLPCAARQILEKQDRMFARDWRAFSSSFASVVTRRDYSYAWLLVNSRTFYYETPETAKYLWEDRLAQLPVADLFNHAQVAGCKVSYSSSGYEFRAQRDYGAGQEIHISYGDHSNDYLLAEYGFVMKPNKWDEVYLDDALLPRLDEKQKVEVEKGSKLTGGFALKIAQGDSNSVGPKLQAALKLLSKTSNRTPEQILSELVGDYLVTTKQTIAEVQATEVGTEAQRELLMRRWEQIHAILEGHAAIV